MLRNEELWISATRIGRPRLNKAEKAGEAEAEMLISAQRPLIARIISQDLTAWTARPIELLHNLAEHFAAVRRQPAASRGAA